MTDQVKGDIRALEIIENLEADGLAVPDQIGVLIAAMAVELHRFEPEYRTAMADAFAESVRSVVGASMWWPVPGRDAVQGAMAEAHRLLTAEGSMVHGYCPQTSLPFVLVLNADGQVLRASVGKQRTPEEQAEAERQATRTLRAEQGLRVVGDDDPTLH